MMPGYVDQAVQAGVGSGLVIFLILLALAIRAGVPAYYRAKEAEANARLEAAKASKNAKAADSQYDTAMLQFIGTLTANLAANTKATEAHTETVKTLTEATRSGFLAVPEQLAARLATEFTSTRENSNKRTEEIIRAVEKAERSQADKLDSVNNVLRETVVPALRQLEAMRVDVTQQMSIILNNISAAERRILEAIDPPKLLLPSPDAPVPPPTESTI